jgi:signal transduction histidine kinase
MFFEEIDEYTIKITLKSDFRHVDEVLNRCDQYFTDRGLQVNFTFKLIFRELLNNAVEHGNKKDPLRMIFCRIGQEKGMWRIEVEDEGEGFDYNQLEFELPDLVTSMRGRGYALINAFSGSFTFNGKGNRVTVKIPMESDL